MQKDNLEHSNVNLVQDFRQARKFSLSTRIFSLFIPLILKSLPALICYRLIDATMSILCINHHKLTFAPFVCNQLDLKHLTSST